MEINKVRTSAGFGVRLTLPMLGQTPLAVDFAVPITRDDQDETQYISFSFGFIQ
jgi:outer membrane protein insertion porin family